MERSSPPTPDPCYPGNESEIDIKSKLTVGRIGRLGMRSLGLTIIWLNSPRSTLQNSNMTPKLSGQNFEFFLKIPLSLDAHRRLEQKQTKPNRESC